MSIRIRRATPADEAAIDRWQQSMESVDEFLHLSAESVRDLEAIRQRYQEWLRLPREKKVPLGWERIDLVAVDLQSEGAICGYAVLYFGVKDQLTGQPEAYMSELHVWPDFRNRGVAKGLLEMAQAYAVQRGVQYLSLHVAAHNAPSIQLYRSLGFREETIKMTKRVARPAEQPQ